MLALQDIGDWIEAIIVLVVIGGSVLGGIGKSILGKLNKQPTIEPEGDNHPKHELKPLRREIVIPPVARPLSPPIAPRGRVVVRTERRTVAPQVEAERVEREFEVPVPEVVRPLVEMLLERAEPHDRPTPPPPPRVQRPRPQRPRPERPRLAKPSAPAITEREARLRDIEEREEQQVQRLEKRIGHVETHVAPAAAIDAELPPEFVTVLDRRSLRKAIILNEVLSPPLALRRGGDRADAPW